MELIDIGANLTHRAFNHDRDEVIAQAVAGGVVTMIVTGTSESESLAAQELAKRYPGTLYATAGVHPHDARHWRPDTSNRLAELATSPEVVAIGETGLDFNRNFSPRPDQERVFEAQLELACDLGMPVFLHERDAQKSLVKILARYRDRLGPVVIHCFTGSGEELAAYRGLDLHIGITGWICDERRGLHLRELIRQIPLDRLMLETDAPFLLPRNMHPKPRNRRNEPAFLAQILLTAAECLGLPSETLATATFGTSTAFFDLASST